MADETTRLITEWGGNYVTWAHCKQCGQSVQYPTEKPYNFCSYCGLRILWSDDKKEGKDK